MTKNIHSIKYSVILPKDADPAFFEYLKNLDCSRVKLYGFNFESIFPRFTFISSFQRGIHCVSNGAFDSS